MVHPIIMMETGTIEVEDSLEVPMAAAEAGVTVGEAEVVIVGRLIISRKPVVTPTTMRLLYGTGVEVVWNHVNLSLTPLFVHYKQLYT